MGGSTREVAHELTAAARAASRTVRIEHRLHWTLRIAAAACFIGHGAFGIITKPEWVPFFGVVGIPRDGAFALMPVVGTVDIIVGLSVLFSPRPAMLLYMTVWAIWTASLRPLSGDNVWEMLERAGNYGVPLAFLVLAGRCSSWRTWFAPIPVERVRPDRQFRVARILSWTTVLLLVGHGALGALEGKALLARHYAAVGLPPIALPIVSWTELSLAVLVLLRPSVPLLLSVAAWKAGTELLFPIAGAPIWEFIERAGSYAAPLALAMLVAHLRPANLERERSLAGGTA